MKITQPITPQPNIQLSNKTFSCQIKQCHKHVTTEKTHQTGTDHTKAEKHGKTPVNAKCSTNSDLNESNRKESEFRTTRSSSCVNDDTLR